MALKMKLAKADFDTLSDIVKEQYKANTDSTEYTLDLDGFEDPGELRRARDREKLAAAEQKQRADALQLEIDNDKEGKSKRRGDIDALELSWKEKNAKLEKDSQSKIDAREKQVRKLLVDNVASGIANKIATVPQLLMPLLKARLEVDFDGDEPKTRVLGGDGKPSALTVAELEKEFADNAEFKAIIRASNATGGGAAGNQGGGASKALKDMDAVERTAYFKRDPSGFERESAANKAALSKT